VIIGRIIGRILLLAAAIVFLRDAIAWYDTGRLAPIAFGQLWSDIDAASFGDARTSVERALPAWLQPPVLFAMLSWWAVPILVVPGALLLRLCRVRVARRRRRR